MREYGRVGVSIWNSQKFLSLENNNSRLVYLYLLTCSHGNSVGCFRLPEGYIMADMPYLEMIEDKSKGRGKKTPTDSLSIAYGYPIDSPIHRALIDLKRAELIGYDEREKVVRIVDYMDHSQISNIKHAAGAVKIAQSLPDCEQKTIVLNELIKNPLVFKNDLLRPEDIPEIRENNSLPIAYGYPIDSLSIQRDIDIDIDKERDKDRYRDREGECERKREIGPKPERIAFDRFNEMAEREKIPKAQVFNDRREKHIRARLKEIGGLDGWDMVLEKISESDFLTGKIKDWQITIDWLIKRENFAKVIEGNYDNKGPGPGSGPRSDLMRAFDRVKEEWGNDRSEND